MTGTIFSVKRYAIHDGPGIRVVFFMKGCPLSCWWCHNPEGISMQPEEVTQTDRVGERDFRRQEKVGKSYEIKDVIAILERERVFMENSGGGVTFSGGEPLMQPLFLKEALSACSSSGFHTAVDTAGFYPTEVLAEILPFTDLFLFDLKHPDPLKHIEFTGVSNDLIHRNLQYLADNKKKVMIRIPVIPGINDSDESLHGFMDIIRQAGEEAVSGINLLPYHTTGSAKYKKFGRPFRMKGFKQPDDERMKSISDFFRSEGYKVKIGG